MQQIILIRTSPLEIPNDWFQIQTPNHDQCCQHWILIAQKAFDGKAYSQFKIIRTPRIPFEASKYVSSQIPSHIFLLENGLGQHFVSLSDSQGIVGFSPDFRYGNSNLAGSIAFPLDIFKYNEPPKVEQSMAISKVNVCMDSLFSRWSVNNGVVFVWQNKMPLFSSAFSKGCRIFANKYSDKLI